MPLSAVRRATLWLLAEVGAERHGDARTARRTCYPRLDPLVRGLVRRRVSTRVASALFETSHGDDEAHVHRLAFLQSLGRAPDPDDRDAVRAVFDEVLGSRPPSAPSAWAWRGPVLALGGLLLAVAAVLLLAPDHWLDPDLVAPTADAYERGGRPMRAEGDGRELFTEHLPRFSTVLWHAHSGEPRAAAEALQQLESLERSILEDTRDAFGAELASFVGAILAQARTIAERPGPAAVDSFLRSVDAFNERLAERGLGHYLDAEVLRETATGRNRVYLSTFTVERVVPYRAGDETVRVLWLSRRDGRGFQRAVLGFTRPQVRDALVLVEPIDEWLVHSVLPAMRADAPLRLTDPETRETAPEWLVRAERTAGVEARREVLPLVGHRDRLAEIGRTLIARQELVDGWAERFAGRLRIARPRAYELDVNAYAPLRGHLLGSEWAQLVRLQDRLEDDELVDARDGLRRALLHSVERHEVQHRIDYATGTLERLPEALARRVGTDHDFARRTMAELSAYLSELAREPRLVDLNLALFASHLLNRRRTGTAEAHAGAAVFEGLARRLGLDEASAALSAAHPERSEVARLLVRLLELPDDQLSAHAAVLWEELTGRPLPEIERLTE